MGYGLRVAGCGFDLKLETKETSTKFLLKYRDQTHTNNHQLSTKLRVMSSEL